MVILFANIKKRLPKLELLDSLVRLPPPLGEIARHGLAAHRAVGIRFQQGGDLCVGQPGGEPALFVAGTEDDRHPAVRIVDMAHERIGLGGDDREGHCRTAALRTMPAVVDPGQGEERTVFQGDEHRDFPVPLMAPPVEPADRDQTAPPADGDPERRMFEDGFRTGVDRLVANRDNVCGTARPERNQPPPERLDSLVAGDDRVGAVRKGADAARRGELFDQIGPAAVMPGQLLRSGCEVNMVTHGEWN